MGKTLVEDCISITISNFKQHIRNKGITEFPCEVYLPFGEEGKGQNFIIEKTLIFNGELDRLWFVCPVCNKRVTKLYMPGTVKESFVGFGCRKCRDLGYRSSYRKSSSIRQFDILVDNWRGESLEFKLLQLEGEIKRIKQTLEKLSVSDTR